VLGGRVIREDGAVATRGGSVGGISSLCAPGTSARPHVVQDPVVVAVALPQKGHTIGESALAIRD
jgi:hypothetical protein